MARYTERVRFSLPTNKKQRLKARAAAMGISMSELIRRIADEAVATDELREADARIQSPGSVAIQ